MSTALVTGASGFIGRLLTSRLIGAGWRVIAITRRPSAVATGVEIRTADLATGSGVSEELFADVDCVFHCAGELRNVAAMSALHVDGTARLIGVIPPGARLRWVQLSSVGAYGPARRAGEPRCVDEETVERPVGAYETTKTAADALVRNAASQGRMSLSILRPANVVGPHMPNRSLGQIAALIRRRLFFYPGRPGIANYVHVDDVVNALLECATNPLAEGELFNLSSDCPWEAITDRVAALAGVPPPRLQLPDALSRVAVNAIGLGFGGSSISAKIAVLIAKTTYASAKIESRLGFRFSRPLPAAIDDCYPFND